jgi:hypothetical protein
MRRLLALPPPCVSTDFCMRGHKRTQFWSAGQTMKYPGSVSRTVWMRWKLGIEYSVPEFLRYNPRRRKSAGLRDAYL